MTLTEHRKVQKAPQGALCPFPTERPHRHHLLRERFRYADGRDEGGVWLLEEIDEPPIYLAPPPTMRPVFAFA